MFMTKRAKVNRITLLDERIKKLTKEIECTELLEKIVILQQIQVAIPFFQSDKLGVYNGALNLYSRKHIGNSHRIADLYETVICMNQVNQTETSEVEDTQIVQMIQNDRNKEVEQQKQQYAEGQPNQEYEEEEQPVNT